jgi:gamma-glutamylcyclotransferase
MKYFAYGSNMLSERLRARVPGATVLGTASVAGRQLQFHKRSKDGSGKCDIPQTGDPADIAHGVLFDVPDQQPAALDRAESAGYGYERTTIDVSFGGSDISAGVYLAVPQHTDARLLPYDWYHALVVAGARQNSLPADYVSRLADVPTKPDSDLARETRREAIEALKSIKTNATGNA